MEVLLAPAAATAVNPGDTVQIDLYTDPGVAVTLPGDWTPGTSDPAALYGTRECARRELTIVAGAAFTWPTVSLGGPSWTAWTWYVGRPGDPAASYSWPQSASVEVTVGG